MGLMDLVKVRVKEADPRKKVDEYVDREMAVREEMARREPEMKEKTTKEEATRRLQERYGARHDSRVSGRSSRAPAPGPSRADKLRKGVDKVGKIFDGMGSGGSPGGGVFGGGADGFKNPFGSEKAPRERRKSSGKYVIVDGKAYPKAVTKASKKKRRPSKKKDPLSDLGF